MARFVQGQSGNPKGRPLKEVADRATMRLNELTSDEKLTEACNALIDGAIAGRFQFVKLYFGYLIGNPTVRIERVGGNAIEEAMAKWKEMQAQSEQQEIEQMYAEPAP